MSVPREFVADSQSLRLRIRDIVSYILHIIVMIYHVRRDQQEKKN